MVMFWKFVKTGWNKSRPAFGTGAASTEDCFFRGKNNSSSGIDEMKLSVSSGTSTRSRFLSIRPYPCYNSTDKSLRQMEIPMLDKNLYCWSEVVSPAAATRFTAVFAPLLMRIGRSKFQLYSTNNFCQSNAKEKVETNLTISIFSWIKLNPLAFKNVCI